MKRKETKLKVYADDTCSISFENDMNGFDAGFKAKKPLIESDYYCGLKRYFSSLLDPLANCFQIWHAYLTEIETPARNNVVLKRCILRCLSCFPLFRRRLSDGDGPQKPVVGVDDPLPSDCGRVDVQVGELLLLLLG